MLTKVVLWRAEYRTDAYTDQCGLEREGYVVLEEIEAEIIDSRLVKGNYSGKKEPWQIGYRARSVTDGRIFECNWDIWSDTNTSPYWLWYEFDTNRTEIVSEWRNAEIVAGRSARPYVKNNVLAIPPLSYCEKHMLCYDENDERGCYKCEIERLRQERSQGKDTNS